MQPKRIELPVETPDGSIIGLLQFAEFHSINRDPKSLNDQILHHHNILQKFQHQWNSQDLRKMVTHSLGEIGNFKEITHSHILAIIIATVTCLACSPCIIFSVMVCCRCAPGCLKSWCPKVKFSCDWLGVAIRACTRKRTRTHGEDAIPPLESRTPSPENIPSAPAQSFVREKSRESKIRKKSLKNNFKYWDDMVKGDEAEQAPSHLPGTSAHMGPIMGMNTYPTAAMYPGAFQIQTPVPAQLHYTTSQFAHPTVPFTPQHDQHIQ